MSHITQHDLDQIKLINKHEYDRMQRQIASLQEAQLKFIDWMKTSDSVIFLTKGERTCRSLAIVGYCVGLQRWIANFARVLL